MKVWCVYLANSDGDIHTSRYLLCVAATLQIAQSYAQEFIREEAPLLHLNIYLEYPPDDELSYIIIDEEELLMNEIIPGSGVHLHER